MTLFDGQTALSLCTLLLTASTSLAADARETFYRTQSAEEGEAMTLRSVRVAITGTEQVGEKKYYWWQLAAIYQNGWHFGIRMLTEGVPLTRTAPIGRCERYLYHDFNGETFEYRDVDTDTALLPMLSFEEKFLPHAAADARYPDGWATAGGFLGHTLVRVAPFEGLDLPAFDNAKRLDLRPALLIAYHASPCYDLDESRKGLDRYRWRKPTHDELESFIESGVNYFSVDANEDDWMIREPIFYRTAPSFPDSFYRSNYYAGRMYIDEPSIRFGWNEHVPGYALMGPEQFAAALRRRVAAHYKLTDRRVAVDRSEGDLDLLYPSFVSWDTHYFSAWQTLAAGAPALVFEGRYRDHGYGWHPTLHFGDEGLEGLTFDDQLHCINAFMRGAARAFDGDWGVSVYHEGQQELFEPAFIKAYDMGARFLWFWSHMPEQGPGINAETVHRLAKAVTRHATRHPRGDRHVVNRAADVGIVLPAGYIYAPGTIMGFEPDQVSPAGATYGEISSAALWEAILCSQRGIDFDFLNDEPFIKDLGYEQLIHVRPDGSLDPAPPWSEMRPATGLTLRLEESTEPPIHERMNREFDYIVAWTDAIEVDGDLSDWPADAWIDLPGDAHGDLLERNATVENVGAAEAMKNHKWHYLGFKWSQLDSELQREYNLQDFYIFGEEITDEAKPGIRITKAGVVVTEVTPGSPADKAGLREGDVITRIHEKRINYEFQIPECLGWYTGKPTLRFEFTRSGQGRVGEADDLRGQAALAVDDETLYVAVRVVDNVHSQPFWGWDFWRGDCVQLGLSPTLSGGVGHYSGEDHELAFVLKDGRPIAWRYQGRQGQGRCEMDRVDLKIKRDGHVTVYEAAIPLSELSPMAPALWPQFGFNIVVNDNDGGDLGQRKGRLELREGAMTRGKRPRDFAIAQCESLPDREKVSASLRWRRRATMQGGFFRLMLTATSPQTSRAQVIATLQSLDSPQTPPVVTRMEASLSPEPREWSLVADTDSPPGRYALDVRVTDPDGRVAAHDRLPVYVYPAK